MATSPPTIHKNSKWEIHMWHKKQTWKHNIYKCCAYWPYLILKALKIYNERLLNILLFVVDINSLSFNIRVLSQTQNKTQWLAACGHTCPHAANHCALFWAWDFSWRTATVLVFMVCILKVYVSENRFIYWITSYSRTHCQEQTELKNKTNKNNNSTQQKKWISVVSEHWARDPSSASTEVSFVQNCFLIWGWIFTFMAFLGSCKFS